jgi:hypothetical protein
MTAGYLWHHEWTPVALWGARGAQMASIGYGSGMTCGLTSIAHEAIDLWCIPRFTLGIRQNVAHKPADCLLLHLLHGALFRPLVWPPSKD